MDYLNESIDYDIIFKENNLKYYLSELNTLSLLSYEEEKEIILRIQNGEKQLCEKLIINNLRLVVSIALRYRWHGLELLDLIQEGNIGLIKAAYNYDSRIGFKFSTYATPSIKRNIMRAIYYKGRTIRVPEYIYKEIIKYEKTVQFLTDKLGRNPSVFEVSSEMNMSISDVELLLNSSKSLISLNTYLYDDDDEEIIDSLIEPIIENDDRIDIDSSFDLNKLFSSLDEKERTIIELRFGLNGYNPMTLEQIGNIFNLTIEGVRKVQNRALHKIRNSESVEEFE